MIDDESDIVLVLLIFALLVAQKSSMCDRDVRFLEMFACMKTITTATTKLGLLAETLAKTYQTDPAIGLLTLDGFECELAAACRLREGAANVGHACSHQLGLDVTVYAIARQPAGRRYEQICEGGQRTRRTEKNCAADSLAPQRLRLGRQTDQCPDALGVAHAQLLPTLCERMRPCLPWLLGRKHS